MARSLSIEAHLRETKGLLRAMADRVMAGLDVLQAHLESPNPEGLLRVVVLDSEVDNLERAVDRSILGIFATKQPLGYDLRLAFSMSKIAHHLERIGDAVESIARQLTAWRPDENKALIADMLACARDIYSRSYGAMFERDLAKIHDLHLLDDRVDSLERQLFRNARQLLARVTQDAEVENALRLITIGSRIEKTADLSCNWAEAIDFAEHGETHRKLSKPRDRIAFVDASGGLLAGITACVAAPILEEIVDVGVLTVSPIVQGGPSVLDFPEFFRSVELEPTLFPVVHLSKFRWNRTIMLVKLGDWGMDRAERETVPHKTVLMDWLDVELPLLEGSSEELHRERYAAIRRRCEELARILARNHAPSEE